MVSGGSDRKCKLQADDADIQLTRNCKKQTHLDGRRRRAQHRQRMLANKIATHTIMMMTQTAPLLRPPLRHQNDCSMQPFAQKTALPGQLLRTLLLTNIIHEYEGLPNTDNR